tara:strand:- start:61 stop:618 length:558 start_codon:yes stop_codon:yes gene_type:complete
MKNILFIIALITVLSCKAQLPIISTVDWANDDDDNIELINGCYLKDVENKFAPFIGTWKWESGNSILEIEFLKVEMVYDGEIYRDHLIGKYRYVDDNGIEKHNSLSVNITPDNVSGYSFYLIRGSGYSRDNYKQFSISDLKKNIWCNLYITLTTPTEAKWKVRRTDGNIPTGGFTFPTELTLIKQ